ncbi:unnamed protein product [marine sediment metagenome]|uniref:Uncharacterized protein n=1 Tax=marine sediment metagenome TaxID=412755 RepID=X0ZNI0_9ZZZZ
MSKKVFCKDCEKFAWDNVENYKGNYVKEEFCIYDIEVITKEGKENERVEHRGTPAELNANFDCVYFKKE